MKCQIDAGYDVSCGPTYRHAALVRDEKPHKCVECGTWVMPREIYEHAFLIYDETPYTYRTCHNCYCVRARFFCSYHYEHLWEAMQEHVTEVRGNVCWDSLAELPPVPQRRVIGMIEKVWEDECDD